MENDQLESVTDRLAQVRSTVAANAARVAALGGWGERVSADTLLARLPQVDETGRTVQPGLGGFDAGVACALDLIPRDAQRLAARLHAAYTPDAVEQARAELADLHPDHETAWWLAACYICTEGPSSAVEFLNQLDAFELLLRAPATRLAAARAAAADMAASFEMRHGLPFAVRDGGMQGAYLAGHDLAGQYAEGYDLFFLGTFRTTLGLEGFAWAEPGDPDAEDREKRLGRSGPVFGSAQFVKCATLAEFTAAAAAARPHDRPGPASA